MLRCFHQFDELEEHDQPWRFCTGMRCYCQGQWIPGRISAMIVYAGLRRRSDRVEDRRQHASSDSDTSETTLLHRFHRAEDRAERSVAA